MKKNRRGNLFELSCYLHSHAFIGGTPSSPVLPADMFDVFICHRSSPLHVALFRQGGEKRIIFFLSLVATIRLTSMPANANERTRRRLHQVRSKSRAPVTRLLWGRVRCCGCLFGCLTFQPLEVRISGRMSRVSDQNGVSSLYIMLLVGYPRCV